MPGAANSKKNSKAKKPQWQRASFGWSGSVFLVDDKLFLDFEYSPERVAALKSFGGAKFYKETKSWSLPLGAIEKLKDSNQFSGLRYYLNQEQFDEGAETRAVAIEQANSYVSLNPFIVPENIFNLAVVEIEIHLNPERGLFIVRPKYRSSGERVLKKKSWLLPSKREQGYIIQAHKIPELISELRDEAISFSVTQSAGTALKSSADLRARIVTVGTGDTTDLVKSYLFPFVMPTEVDYRLCGWSPEHLQLFFPNTEGFPERKKLAESLSEQ